MTPTALLAAVLLPASVEAQVFLGPSPYLQFADSPLDTSGSFVLEDFEDNLLNVPGVSADFGSPYGPGGITDSVDEDDGAIDGSGVNGHSFFMVPGSTGIRFTFSPVAGEYPTQAGIVWTDGAEKNLVTFEAFDTNGVSLGSIVAGGVGDGNFNNSTAEDRFFGVQDASGIGAIHIKSVPESGSGGSGLEVDHLQFGYDAAVWTNLGFALTGTSGLPQLVGTGSLLTGTPGALTLSSARPASPAYLFVALTNGALPFKGGTLVPLPPLLTLALLTSGSGGIALPWAAWPAGLSGLDLYFQYAIQDAGAVQGAALSNALKADVP